VKLTRACVGSLDESTSVSEIIDGPVLAGVHTIDIAMAAALDAMFEIGSAETIENQDDENDAA